MGGDRLCLSLECERLDLLHLDRVAHERERRRAEQDLAGLRRLLEPGGDVDGVARRQPLLGACDHLAGVDADPSLDVELGKRIAHLRRRTHRPQRVVLVRDRHAEHGHHGVSDELLHRAAVRLDNSLHPLEVPRQQRPQQPLDPSDSPRAVEPVTSQNSTVTVFRNSRAGAAVENGAAQWGQNWKSPSLSRPQLAQTTRRRG